MIHPDLKNDDLEVAPALSRFIAGLIGPALLTIGVSVLVNGGLAATIATEIAGSKGLIVFSGVSLLVAGLAILQCHATWRGWPAVITALGWLSIVSGLVRILLPFQLADLAAAIVSHQYAPVAAVICIGLGGYLSVKAYL